MLTTTTAFVHVTAGAPQNGPAPGVARLDPPRRATRVRAHDHLLVLIELQNAPAAADTLYRQVMAAMAERFYQSQGSLTAAMRDALLAAHALLARDNHAAPAGTQVTGGALCAVVRPGATPDTLSLFLAQSGPSVAFLAREGLCDRYPLLPEPGDQPRGALGDADEPDVQLYQETLAVGDVLFCVEGHLERLVSAPRLNDLLNGARAEEVAQALHQFMRAGNLSGLVLEIAAAPTAPAPATVAHPAGATPASGISGTPGTPAAPPTSPGFKLPSLPSWMRTPRAPAAPEEAPTTADDAHDEAPAPAPDRVTEFDATHPTGDDAGDTDEAGASPAVSGTPASTPRTRRTPAPQTGAGARVSNALTTFLTRILPEGPARANRAARPERIIPAWAVWATALLIPLLVASVTTVIWFQQGQAFEVQEALNRARAEISLARAAPNAPEAHTHWQAALAALDEAEHLGARGNEVITMRLEAQGKLDALDQVTRLEVRLLRDFTSEAHPTRVIFQNLNLFTFDGNGSRLYADALNANGTALLDPSSDPVLFARQLVDKRPVTQLVDMAWLSASTIQRNSVLITLDKSGVLFSYSQAWGLTATPLIGANQWQKPRAINTYVDRLYILDPPANQIWRYENTEQGFIQPPTTYFDPSGDQALATTVDFSIDTAGNLYMLYENGTLRKFFNGVGENFVMAGLPQPLTKPSGFFIGPDPLTSSIYIAEPITRRIVRLSQGGTFLDQYRVNGGVFDNISGLYVDETSGRIFVVSGTGLYVAYAAP